MNNCELISYEIYRVLGRRLPGSLNNDELVKSILFRHSRVGGNPESTEMTRSKSSLISRLRGNDKELLN